LFDYLPTLTQVDPTALKVDLEGNERVNSYLDYQRPTARIGIQNQDDRFGAINFSFRVYSGELKKGR